VKLRPFRRRFAARAAFFFGAPLSRRAIGAYWVVVRLVRSAAHAACHLPRRAPRSSSRPRRNMLDKSVPVAGSPFPAAPPGCAKTLRSGNRAWDSYFAAITSVPIRFGTKPTGIRATTFSDFRSTATVWSSPATPTYAREPSGVSVIHSGWLPTWT